MEFLSNKPLLITDTILRDAHQSQAATRMTIEDMIPALEQLDSIGVKKNLKLIGAFSHIRICAPENWTLPENPEEYLDAIQEVSDGSDGLEALGGLLGGVFGK